jgi:hypothetical protein
MGIKVNAGRDRARRDAGWWGTSLHFTSSLLFFIRFFTSLLGGALGEIGPKAH